MKKLIKVLGIIIAAVFTLLVAVVIAVTLFVNPNDYKSEIASQVKEKTGRTLKIEGNISLSFFPWIGFEVRKAELGNAPGFGSEPFASVKEVGVKVKLLPLFSRRVEMDTVTLDGLNLHLIRNKQGKDNWSQWGASAPAKKAPASSASPSGAGALAGLAINGVNVSDAHIAFDDLQSGARWSVDKLNLRTGQLGGGKPVDLKLSFDLHAGRDARPRRFDLAGRVAFDAEKHSLNVTKLVVGFAGVQLTGAVHGTDLQKAPQFSGDAKVAEFVPREVLQQLDLPLPATNDPTVFGKASLHTQFTASPQAVELKNLVVKLDDTTLRGEAGVRNFSSPAITYKLAVDNIDLDRYLPPPPPKGQAKAQAKAASPGTAVAGIPVKALRGLNLNGTLTIAKLKAYNLRSEGIKVTTVARHGDLRIHPASARLYGGTYNGDVRIDARGREPLLSINEKLHDVQAQPLLKDAMGKDWISGKANLTTQLTAKGAQPAAIRRTLNGVVTFSFLNGSIKGVNIPLLIRKASATLHGQPAPPDEAEQTDFTSLKGTASVRNGLVTNRDLTLQSPLIRVTGSGTADLVSEKVDYTIKTVLVASLKGQGGSTLEKLKGVPIPIRVTGTFQKPSFGVDLASVIKGAEKARIEKKKKEVEQKLRNKLQDKLKGLFK